MDEQVYHKGYPSTGSMEIGCTQFLGRGVTLGEKRKQRKLIQNDQKEMANKLLKLEQEQEKAVKDIQKKYKELQNIYKIRLRKQTQQEHKQKIKLQKEEEIRLLKLQWKNQRQRNATKKKESDDTIFQNNRKLYLLGKSSKRSMQTQRQNVQKKLLQRKANQSLDMKQKKGSRSNKSTGDKKINDQQFVNHYNLKMNEQQQKKNKNIQNIKNMAEKHRTKLVEYQKSISSKQKILSLIKRAHEIDLLQLQKQMIQNQPNVIEKVLETNKRKSNLSRSQFKSKSKSKRKSAQLFYNAPNIYLKNNPEEQIPKAQKKNQPMLSPNFEETMKAIQILELQNSENNTSVIKSRILET